MAKLPTSVQELLKSGHDAWIATVGSDGWPNVALKGSVTVLDEEHVFFADLFSKKTRENLLHDPRVAVGLHAPERDLAIQLKGWAVLISSGELFERVADRFVEADATEYAVTAVLMRRGAKSNGSVLGFPRPKHIVQIQVVSIWDMGLGPHAGEQIHDVSCSPVMDRRNREDPLVDADARRRA